MLKVRKTNLEALNNNGFLELSKIFEKYSQKIYIVGGAVRDAFLGIDIDKVDFDLSTPCHPEEVIFILAQNKIKYHKTGFEFGTVTVSLMGCIFEITSFREDIITDGRHAVVKFGTNMLNDAKRRDFTINALYYDSHGFIYDPLETGILDLNQTKVRFIGNAHLRIQEDFLRIIRYFRFLARFGLASYDKNIFLQYDYSRGLKSLSEHRIRNELIKFIHYPYAAEVIDLLLHHGYADIIFSNLIIDIEIFKSYRGVTHDITYYIASLMMKTAKEDIKKNKLLTNLQKKLILQFKTLYFEFEKSLKAQDWLNIGLLYYDYPYQLWFDLLTLMQNMYDDTSKIKLIKEIKFPEFTLTGKDILNEGYQEGQIIATILQQRKKLHIQRCLSTYGL